MKFSNLVTLIIFRKLHHLSGIKFDFVNLLKMGSEISSMSSSNVVGERSQSQIQKVIDYAAKDQDKNKNEDKKESKEQKSEKK